MSSKFPLAVKSTIDYVAMQIATPLNLAVVDMDAAGLFAELLESDDTAIVWAIGSLAEAPMDPLWYVDFDIGVKTSLDPAQYKSLDVLSSLTDTFKVGKIVEVRDYSGDVAGTAIEGRLFVSSVTASPSQPDRLSGIRLINVQCRVMRIG
jgi:hypothetical protein